MLIRTTAFAVAAFLAGSHADASWLCGGANSAVFDVARNPAAVVVKGPATVVVKNLNRVRYDAKLSSTVTVTPGPDIAIVGFITLPPAAAPAPAAPAVVAQAFAARGAGARRTADQEMADIEVLLVGTAGNVVGLRTNAQTAITSLDAMQQAVQNLAADSNRLLATGGDTALAAAVAAVNVQLTGLAAVSWPTSAAIAAERNALLGLRGRLEAMPLQFADFFVWAMNGSDRDRYRQALAGITQLLAVLDALGSASPEYVAFAKGKTALLEWQRILSPLGIPAAFSETIDAKCDYPFIENRKTEFKLTLSDRIEPDPAKKLQPAQAVAVVDCPSSVSVSGGIGLSGQDEADIEIISVPNSTGAAVERKIAFRNRSSEQVNPILLIHTRVTDSSSCNAHITGGTVLDTDHPDSGVRIGYVAGISFSWRDHVYLTAGAQYGRTSQLAAGVDRNTPVPAALTEPPLEQAWHGSWVIGMTYKIR